MKTIKFLKGICYDAFPHGYDPSTANTTCIWFGSDMARYNTKPLWGKSFSPIDGPDAGKIFEGRDDLNNLNNLGVNLIRLYDWDPRNDHMPFLDYCYELGIQVLVPVSNYNLGAFGTPPDMTDSITSLINSFSYNNDYHPAIYGIIIGSEMDQLPNVPISYVSDYTQKWVQIESVAYSNYRKVPIGHPISFATNGPGWSGKYPCFGYLDELLPPLITNTTRDLNKRLMLCPHTYNEASYLYDNAEGSGKGWIELAYDTYNLPILICEIGCSRLTRDDYLDVVQDQLLKSVMYNQTDKLLGICYFQYCDKVWTPNTSEGSFGLVNNTDKTTDIVCYGPKDFCHYDGFPCTNNSLNIQILENNPVINVLQNAYDSEYIANIMDTYKTDDNTNKNVIVAKINDKIIPLSDSEYKMLKFLTDRNESILSGLRNYTLKEKFEIKIFFST